MKSKLKKKHGQAFVNIFQIVDISAVEIPNLYIIFFPTNHSINIQLELDGSYNLNGDLYRRIQGPASSRQVDT